MQSPTTEKEPIAGWSYLRYAVGEIGPVTGTMMAVDPNTPKVNRFIRLGGEPAPQLKRWGLHNQVQ